MKNTVILLVVFLAGCATGQKAPFQVTGTEHSVTVNWAQSPSGAAGALGAAEAHCAQYGKHAQFAGKLTDSDLAYNCVK